MNMRVEEEEEEREGKEEEEREGKEEEMGEGGMGRRKREKEGGHVFKLE
jgi:hypothetical protein